MADSHVPIQNDNESDGLADETYSIKVQELAGSGMNFVFVPKMEQTFGSRGNGPDYWRQFLSELILASTCGPFSSGRKSGGSSRMTAHWNTSIYSDCLVRRNGAIKNILQNKGRRKCPAACLVLR
ncbi:MAG: hypothetical protein ACM3JB_06335 [Acidobacteriaceae bacterium]